MFCHDMLATDLSNAEFSPLCCCLGYSPNLSPAWLSEGLFKVIRTSLDFVCVSTTHFGRPPTKMFFFSVSAVALRIFRVHIVYVERKYNDLFL